MLHPLCKRANPMLHSALEPPRSSISFCGKGRSRGSFLLCYGLTNCVRAFSSISLLCCVPPTFAMRATFI